jgi:hypothetical protein
MCVAPVTGRFVADMEIRGGDMVAESVAPGNAPGNAAERAR